MKKCPSVSVFWRQWHRGDRKFKTMALKGCSNFQWHIWDELHFSVAYREFTQYKLGMRPDVRRWLAKASAQTDVLADPTEPAKGELEATITASCLQLSRKQRVSLVLQLVPSWQRQTNVANGQAADSLKCSLAVALEWSPFNEQASAKDVSNFEWKKHEPFILIGYYLSSEKHPASRQDIKQ